VKKSTALAKKPKTLTTKKRTTKRTTTKKTKTKRKRTRALGITSRKRTKLTLQTLRPVHVLASTPLHHTVLSPTTLSYTTPYILLL
jgi:hypothetical protein